MSLNTSLAEGQMPTYSMPQPQRYPTSAYPSASASTYNKSYPTASSYTGSGRPEGGYTGPTSSYPLASSGSGYNQPYTGARSYTGSTSTAPQQYTGSTSTAPQQYSGSTSSAPYTGSTSAAPQQYPGSTSTAPYTGSTSAAPQQYAGSTSQYPAPMHSSSVSSYPAPTEGIKPRETLPSTASYAPSSATAVNNNTATKAYQSQQSTFSRATARSHASLSPAARLAQRGPPPRMRPWMIILVTMAVGLLFIGIVLTVVAHWPGYTSIGSDPLEIVGPVLLAVGGAGLIVCVVLSVIHSRKEKESFMKKIAASQRSIYNSRMTMQQSMHSIANMDSQSQGMMMKHPSTSTYGGPVGDGDSGHPSTQTYNSTNMSYEPDSDASEQGAGKYEVYRIDTLPDPNAPVTTTSAAPQDTNNAQVPQPVRTRTRDKKKKAKADPKYTADISSDPNYQPSPAGAGRTSPMAGSGALGAGIASPMSGAPDLGRASNRPARQMHNYSGDGFDMYDPDGEAKRAQEKPKKKSRRPKREAEAMQASGYTGEGPQEPHRPQEPLRIAIRAQPGAQVSITPGFSSYSQETRHDSAETEI